MVVANPYNDENLNNGVFMRSFSKDVLSEELVWHRDHSDRRVEVLEGKDWEIQVENGLPRKLNEGDTVWIPALTYHRIKRGTTDLVLRIEEFK